MYHARMTKLDSGSGSLGSSGAVGARVVGGARGVGSASGGVRTRPYAGLSSDLAAVERRADPKYRGLVNAAAKKTVSVQEAMRNKTWRQSMTNDAEQAALDALKHGKSIGLSQSDVNHDLRTAETLRHK